MVKAKQAAISYKIFKIKHFVEYIIIELLCLQRKKIYLCLSEFFLCPYLILCKLKFKESPYELVYLSALLYFDLFLLQFLENTWLSQMLLPAQCLGVAAGNAGRLWCCRSNPGSLCFQPFEIAPWPVPGFSATLWSSLNTSQSRTSISWVKTSSLQRLLGYFIFFFFFF